MPSVPTDLLACPVCRDVVTEGPGRVTCASCGRRYSVDDGVPDFLLSPPVDGLDAAPGPIGRSLGAIVGIPPVYDLVQRLAGVEETLTRVGRKLEQAAGALVLDIGGGTGRIEAVLPAAARYLWLDADRQKLRGFRTKSASPAILGDATRLPLMDRSVDWAVCLSVSHHLDDDGLGLMLDELRRVTRDRVVFLDAVTSPARRSRLLWHYDRGRHPRDADVLRRELSSRFEIVTAEEFTLLHRYLLVSAV